MVPTHASTILKKRDRPSTVPHHADVLVGHAVYPAIGRYPFGASDNAGLGMWTQELSAGTTVYFNVEKACWSP